MKTQSPKPMTKHEACYWLNALMINQRSMLEYTEKQDRSERVRDADTNEMRDPTTAEMERFRAYDEGRAAEYRKTIEALDIAATALTK